VDYVFASHNGTPEDLKSLFTTSLLAFDVEGTGTHPRSDVPLGYSMSIHPSSAYYVDIDNQYLKQALMNPNTLYIAHNAKYDRSMLKKAGITINNLCDTMIAAHLCEEPHLSLLYLVGAKTGRYIPVFSELQKPFTDMSLQEMLDYSGPHSRAALVLWTGFSDSRYDWPGYEYELRRNILAKVFWELEMPLLPVLSDMELNGAAIATTYLNELGSYFDEQMGLLLQVLYHYAGTDKVNFNSPDQVADLFYNKLGIKPTWKRTQSGRPTVEAKDLEKIKHHHPIIPIYLRYKHFGKLKGTYVNALLRDVVDGRIYCNFNQTGTDTGRLSSSGPNLQNIPARTEEGKKIRRAFIAPPGTTLVKADADQLELKKMAIRSKDPHMLQAFKEGRDIHLETAIRALGSASKRREGKTLNFQVQYGGGDDKNRELFYGAYPGVLAWTKKIHAEAIEIGYVRTLFGRKRTIPLLKSSNPRAQEEGGRKAVSTIIQGSSAEVIKVGMRRIWEDIKDSDIKMILQVHDELVFEVPDPLVGDFVPHLAERLRYDELEIPITYTISTGKNWRDMEEWKCQ